MTLGIVVGVIVVAFVVMFTKPGVFIKGMWNSLFTDLAKTPEGAETLFNEKIEETQDSYNAAHDALQRVSGELYTAEKVLTDKKMNLKNVEGKIESFVKAGREDCDVFLSQREEYLVEISELTATVSELKEMTEQAKMISNKWEIILSQLKTEKVKVVEGLKRDQQLKDIYDELNTLKNTSNVDKLLTATREGAKEKRETAVGARVVHENKTETKLEKLDETARKISTNDYLEEVKRKVSTSQTKDR